MRTGKFPLRILIVVLILGVGASAFWAGHASSGSPSSEVKTYQPGWANIAWLDDTAPVGAALSSIADSVGVVYYLDPDSGSWQRYISGRPEVSTLTTMAFGKSYLLLFTKPATLEQATQPEDVCAPGGCPAPSEVACNSLYPCPLPVDIECLQALTECQTYLAECTNGLISCRNDLENCADDFSGQSLCELLDELDELQWANLSTAFAVDCGLAFECELQCDLDSGFERDVNAVADFLRTSPPFNLSLWQLRHCIGPFYRP